MVAPTEEGIDLFKIAGRSISGWIPSFKMGGTAPVKQPFCSHLEERLLLWLEYHPQVVSYTRGDIGPQFATAYRLPLPKHAPFAIGYTFEGNPMVTSLCEQLVVLRLTALSLRCRPTMQMREDVLP